jgi:hypothetical protein
MEREALWAIGVGVAVSMGAVQAYAGGNEEKCTLAALNGQYLFNGSGTRSHRRSG